MDRKKSLYVKKENDYFSQDRPEIRNLIRGRNLKILDVGCGTGNVLQALKKEGKANRIVGVEIDESTANKARKVLDEVLEGDLEEIEITFKEDYFDYIILADVLEHLIDPWAALKKISRYLKRGGYIVSSIPNVRSLKVLLPIIFLGKWEYEKQGILDKGHLRFFTLKSIRQLFGQADFKNITIMTNPTKKTRLINLVTLGTIRDFIATQYLIKAQKKL